MAPVKVMAQKAITHSGRFRMTMATRSPCCHPELVDQPVGQRAGDAVVLGEAGPLVLVDQIGGVAVPEGQVEDDTQRRRRVLPGAGGDAADDALLHLEQLPGRRQGGVGLGQRNRRRVLLDGHGSGVVGAGVGMKMAVR